MTPRTFWIVTVKIIGICIAYQLLATVYKTLSLVITYVSFVNISIEHNAYINVDLVLLSTLIILILYILLFYLFVFKTTWIINKLKLDKGYEDENFELNVHYSTILRVIISIIGGLLIINVFPALIEEIFFSMQKPLKYEMLEQNRNIVYAIADAIKILIGLFMVIYTKAIVNYISKKENKNIVETPTE